MDPCFSRSSLPWMNAQTGNDKCPQLNVGVALYPYRAHFIYFQFYQFVSWKCCAWLKPFLAEIKPVHLQLWHLSAIIWLYQFGRDTGPHMINATVWIVISLFIFVIKFHQIITIVLCASYEFKVLPKQLICYMQYCDTLEKIIICIHCIGISIIETSCTCQGSRNGAVRI